ncbi:hypothetical protein jaqu_14480 [Jannaschia aquimarina]|uniref:DUF5666 domain-containing protein n=1 Tax=Jannaschia aquimarina TaxID=935700 RepID=A0A0D1EH18_9RHOB|nr:hypothetical protein [Jannaschia aquimarina]KIT16949.1 hypothetical protein jaqu_14480 [Jannaschia aquimarina]
MKTLIASALAASALVAALPAAAQVPAGPAGAIAHFNQDIDTANDRASLDIVRGETVTVSSRSGSVAQAIAHFNADLDAGDRVPLTGGTVVSGSPTYGAEIFANIRAESLEDE